jgi:hypothetical protein
MYIILTIFITMIVVVGTLPPFPPSHNTGEHHLRCSPYHEYTVTCRDGSVYKFIGSYPKEFENKNCTIHEEKPQCQEE